MLVLSLDTTTRAGSCALLRDEGAACEQASDASREQAGRLPGDLAALLDRESVALPEIDCFAVATGPGSFTGLRVGIATMQGLAMATGKPLIGVSAFDALATIGGSTLQEPPYSDRRPEDGGQVLLHRPGGQIAAWIDAWRGEVFAAVYTAGGSAGEPSVGRPEDLLVGLTLGTVVFTGDGAARHRALIRQALGDCAGFTDPVAPALAGAIARLAAAQFLAGWRPAPHAIRPIYVRRFGAEPSRDALRG